MRWLLVGSSWLVWTLALLVACSVPVTPAAVAETYSFQDEFDGPAGSRPEPTKWSYVTGDGGWGNGELQTYTDSRENSFLDGHGNLVIRATKAVAPGGAPDHVSYKSARLTTIHHFSQRYGHWEARIKVQSERGLWPAWWMLGDNYPSVGWPGCGEVDMVEDYGFSAVESSIHAPTKPPAYRTFSGTTPNDSQFHVFALDWTADGMSFSRDGVRYAAVAWNADPGNRIFDPQQPMFMLLNLAVGGRVGVPSNETVFPIDLVVDYVRVRQN
jgi:beta-glucanase (GH16 family)